MIKDVTDFEVYNESLMFLKELYEFLNLFPLSEYDTKNQCKRAGKSIPALIAEGYAKKNSEKEFKRFLLMALGSSDEIISHLRVVAITIPKLASKAKLIAEKYKALSKRLNKLHSIWQKY